MSKTDQGLKYYLDLVGSPFVEGSAGKYSDEELLSAYDHAFPNRIALLYLTLHRREGWDERLEEKYQALYQREQMTFEVIATLADCINKYDRDNYIIFKSVKPYPATPNDTDVIWMGDSASYEDFYKHILEQDYKFHEWAPQQRTVYDPRGVGKIGSGKKGGTYYIDLYQEISTDYYAYLNKYNLKPFVYVDDIKGVQVNLLRPEPELAIVLFHSVFPERTFQLEHFFVPLYMIKNPDFDLEVFMRFAAENGLGEAVSTQFSLIRYIHEKFYGTVPEPVETVVSTLGENKQEVARFIEFGETTPYLFSGRAFWTAFAQKTMDWYSFRSLMWQGVKMMNPKFFVEVMGSIRHRFSEKGAYHLE